MKCIEFSDPDLVRTQDSARDIDLEKEDIKMFWRQVRGHRAAAFDMCLAINEHNLTYSDSVAFSYRKAFREP